MNHKPVDTKIMIRYFARETAGIAIMGAALFLSAGTLNWWQGWATLGIVFFWVAGTAIVILKNHPGLLAERLGPKKGGKKSDLIIMSFLGILQLARYIISGLDLRYSWTENFPEIFQYIAAPVCFFSHFLAIQATAENAYFSQIYRIQKERGQKVVASGPYRFVRHPAYSGAFFFEIFVSFLLGSLWGFIPGIINSGLLVLRTALEDRGLQKDLTGYSEYSRKVKYRLIPGIW